jgi:hypothetical protein
MLKERAEEPRVWEAVMCASPSFEVSLYHVHTFSINTCNKSFRNYHALAVISSHLT